MRRFLVCLLLLPAALSAADFRDIAFFKNYVGAWGGSSKLVDSGNVTLASATTEFTAAFSNSGSEFVVITFGKIRGRPNVFASRYYDLTAEGKFRMEQIGAGGKRVFYGGEVVDPDSTIRLDRKTDRGMQSVTYKLSGDSLTGTSQLPDESRSLGEYRRIPAAGDSNKEWINWLPAVSAKAELMGLVSTPRQRELSAKFAAAIAKRRAWWQSFIRQNADTRPLPYHPYFGISQDEYDEMLAQSEEFTLKSIKEIGVIRMSAEHLHFLHFDDSRITISPLVLDTKRNMIHTVASPLLSEGRHEATKGLLGPSVSFKWSRQDKDTKAGNSTSATVTLGIRKSDGKRFVRLQAAKVRDHQSLGKTDSLISYSAKGR